MVKLHKHSFIERRTRQSFIVPHKLEINNLQSSYHKIFIKIFMFVMNPEYFKTFFKSLYFQVNIHSILRVLNNFPSELSVIFIPCHTILIGLFSNIPNSLNWIFRSFSPLYPKNKHYFRNRIHIFYLRLHREQLQNQTDHKTGN